jgi:ribonuclease-3
MTNQTIFNIEQKIGYTFKNKDLLIQAFTRKSYTNEHPEAPNNELLEHLGDRVLGVVIDTLLIDGNSSDTCFKDNLGAINDEFQSETKNEFLAEQMRRFELHEFMRVSNGDITEGVREGDKALSDLLESIVGAVWIDSEHDYSSAETVVKTLLNLD